MEKKFTLKLASVVLAVAILFSSCASTTVIQSYPSGAKVYIEGEPVGVTPYWYTDTKIMGSVTNIDLIKEGYQPLYTSIQRDERLDFGALFSGFFLYAPFLWSLRYAPVHNYELVPLALQPPQEPNTMIVPLPEKQEQALPQPTPQTEPVSPKIQKLRELKQMLDEKLITKEDFEKQKQKILDEK